MFHPNNVQKLESMWLSGTKSLLYQTVLGWINLFLSFSTIEQLSTTFPGTNLFNTFHSIIQIFEKSQNFTLQPLSTALRQVMMTMASFHEEAGVIHWTGLPIDESIIFSPFPLDIRLPTTTMDHCNAILKDFALSPLPQTLIKLLTTTNQLAHIQKHGSIDEWTIQGSLWYSGPSPTPSG